MRGRRRSSLGAALAAVAMLALFAGGAAAQAVAEDGDLCAPGQPGVVYGTNGADRLTGTNGADVICGRGGNDQISGRGGDDLIDAARATTRFREARARTACSAAPATTSSTGASTTTRCGARRAQTS